MNEEMQDYIEIAEAMEKTKVYIETDGNNHIIEVFSSDFKEPTATSILIDEGNGDRYRHAQSQYFEKPLVGENGNYNYKFENSIVKENYLC